MVINNEGIPLKSTLDSSTTVNHEYWARFETLEMFGKEGNCLVVLEIGWLKKAMIDKTAWLLKNR